MSIQGKQLATNTIVQNQLNLAIPTASSDATRKDYVDGLINTNLSVERVSTSNQNMAGVFNIGVTYIACNTPLLQDPIYNSEVSVYVNGMQVNCAENQECFFSPDGVIIREINDVRIGDRLYWNTTYADYDIDENDIIDFKYLINDSSVQTVEMGNGDIIELSDDDIIASIKFTGGDDESGTLIITGVSFSVGNVGTSFTFDIGDTNGLLHTFTYIGENYEIDISGSTYGIVWNGISSIYFSAIKGYAFDIDRYSGLINYEYFSASNPITQSIELTDRWLCTGGYDDHGIMYIFEKVNNGWDNQQILLNTDIDTYPVEISMTNNYIISVDYEGKFKLFRWSSIIENWDTGTTITTIDRNSHVNIDIDQFVISSGNYNSYDGIVKVYSIDNEEILSNVTIDYPYTDISFKFGFGQCGVKILKNNKLVIGLGSNNPAKYNQIYVYNYSGGIWTGQTLLDRLPGELTTNDKSNDNEILDFKENIILCGCPTNQNYSPDSGTNSGVAYIYEYSGETWWLSQLPFPTGNTTNLYLGENGKIIIDNNITYLYVSRSPFSSVGRLGDIFIYKKINDDWEIIKIFNSIEYPHLPNLTFGNVFSVGDDMSITIGYKKYLNIFLFSGKSLTYLPNKLGNYPNIGNIYLDGNVTTGNTISLLTDYLSPVRYDEDMDNSLVIWNTKQYTIDSFTEDISLRNVRSLLLTNDLYGYTTQITLQSKDIYGNIGNQYTKQLMILNYDNLLFNMNNNFVNDYGQSITLTILTGNLQGNGPGVYTLLSNYNPTQGSTSSWWGMSMGGNSTTGFSIYGTSSGYASMNIYTSSTSTSVSTSDSTATSIVSNLIFTTYTLGNVSFTISKNTGWRSKS